LSAHWRLWSAGRDSENESKLTQGYMLQSTFQTVLGWSEATVLLAGLVCQAGTEELGKKLC